MILLALAVPMCLPPPAYADTHTVTESGNSGAGTLRDAILSAADGDTILFDDVMAGQTITLTEPLSLDKDLTIDGSALASPVTISGGSAVRVLEVVTATSASLVGLVLVDGQVSEIENHDDPLAAQGGGILNHGTLTLTECTFTGHRGAYGGAIASATDAAMTITGCTFSGNYAAFSGGAIYSAGSLALDRSVVSANEAGAGGGVVNGAQMTVTACTFDGNTAAYAGAIGNGATLTVSGSTLIGNTAQFAGAILNMDTLMLTNTTLAANAVTGMAEVPTIGGGALLNLGAATIRHATFSGNSAPAGTGGGIANSYQLDYANTIVAGSTGGDCVLVSDSDPGDPPRYEITVNEGNLVEDGSCQAAFSGDPLLGPLADNGGPTQTMALLPGSPAINAAVYERSLSFDQRGLERPDGQPPDIGAYELQAPTAAVTGGVDNLSSFGARLQGTATAGDRASAAFEYGLTDAYGTSIPAAPEVVTGTAGIPVSAPIEGLDPNTTYHYRLVLDNDAGPAYGQDETFTSAATAPATTTGEATDVLAAGATLHAAVTAYGLETAVAFEYGTTTNYGSTVVAATSPLSGRTEEAVSAVLTGLATNQTYHYRVAATNLGGETHGEDRTFTTGQNAPVAVTGLATGVGKTSAVLRGTVNAQGYPATVAFSYGLTTAYGTTVPAEPESVGGGDDVAVMCILSDLLPNTLYHYRVEAQSAGGTTYGEDATFSVGDLSHVVAVPLVWR